MFAFASQWFEAKSKTQFWLNQKFALYLCMSNNFFGKISCTLAILTLFIYPTILAQKTGNASYYSNKLEGRRTSDGGRYHRDSMTCAHLSYPFGTILKVRNPKNDREIIVKVTDRGPHSRRLMIDLSYRAAYELDIIRAGIAKVEISKLDSMPFRYPAISPIPVPKTGFLVQKPTVNINIF